MRKDLSARASLEELASRDVAHLWHPYTQMSTYPTAGVMIAAAEGSRITDSQGRSYLDGTSGLWTVNCGHRRRQISDAIRAQLETLHFYPLNGYAFESAVELASRLASIAPKGLGHVFFGCGGAESVETAIKISRGYFYRTGRPERTKIVSLDRGWHGCTLGALSAAGIPDEREGFGPFAPGFHQAASPYTFRERADRSSETLTKLCLEDMKRVLNEIGPDTVAAVIVEAVQGAGGMVVLPDALMREIRALTRSIGCHMIVDEVATGFGRTGKLFASEHSGIEPDFIICAKALTNGAAPLSAVLATDEIYGAYLGGADRAFSHGYTFGGHPISCAAGVATLGILLEEKLAERAAQSGEALLSKLRSALASSRIVSEVRGRGMMIGIEIAKDCASPASVAARGSVPQRICLAARKRGVMVRSIGDVIPIMFPLSLADDELASVVDGLTTSIGEVAQALASE